MAAAVTPVRDPGMYASKSGPWVSGENTPTSEHAMDQVHRSQPPPAASHKSKSSGRYHHHKQHRSRRNTSPSLVNRIGLGNGIKCKVDAAFLTACKNSDVALLTTVTQKPVTPETANHQDKTGKTGLSHVCSNGSLDILRILISVPQIDVNLADNDGSTPLMIAAQAGHADILANLLKHYEGSLILDQRNLMGFTSLMKASLQGRVKCVKLLLQAGASPWLTDYGRGYYALQWAKYCGRHACADVIERFLKSTNQKQPPVLRKKNAKQKQIGSKSCSETDLLIAIKTDGTDSANKDGAAVNTDQNFNQCPAEKSNIHDQKGWLKRGLKKAFQKKSNDMKVLGNITGVGMVAAASGGIISNSINESNLDGEQVKGEMRASNRVVPKLQVTNTS